MREVNIPEGVAPEGVCEEEEGFGTSAAIYFANSAGIPENTSRGIITLGK